MFKISAGFALAITLCASIPSATFAQETVERDGGHRANGETHMAAVFRRGQYETFMRAVLSRPPDIRAMNTVTPEFSVPAVPAFTIICQMTRGGLECLSELADSNRCPGQVEIRVPGERPVNVDVDCTGPDSEGNCECEFAQK